MKKRRTNFSVRSLDLFKVYTYNEKGRGTGTFYGKGRKGIMQVYVYTLNALKEKKGAKGLPFVPRFKIVNLSNGLSAGYDVKETSNGSIVFKCFLFTDKQSKE